MAWNHLKRDFTLSHSNIIEAKAKSVVSGYQSTNAVYQRDTFNAISNLATDTEHNHQTVATLSTTNSTLTLDLTAVNKNIVTALLGVTKISIKLLDLKSKLGVFTAFLEPMHYCWSCGYKKTH